MVLPTEPEGELGLVQVVRNQEGRFIGFRDVDTGRFISRADAIPRLRYSVEKSSIIDSFGTTIGPGSLALPQRGETVSFKLREAEYLPLQQSPESYRPNANQEIIERTILVTREGKIITDEVSHGLGTAYDPAKYGGHWRKKAAEALGVREGDRLPTVDLKRAVVYREFLLKTIE